MCFTLMATPQNVIGCLFLADLFGRNLDLFGKNLAAGHTGHVVILILCLFFSVPLGPDTLDLPYFVTRQYSLCKVKSIT